MSLYDAASYPLELARNPTTQSFLATAVMWRSQSGQEIAIIEGSLLWEIVKGDS